MHFAPDVESTLGFVVAVANTAPEASRTGDDELVDPGQLGQLLAVHDYSGRIDGDVDELEDARATRELLRRLWSAELPDLVDEINRILRAHSAVPQLVKHDRLDWHFHATASEAPLSERIQVEAALALADIVRAGEVDRMRVCDADDCTGLLLDLSRNGSKRFCSVRCGNRVNQLAFRERNT